LTSGAIKKRNERRHKVSRWRWGQAEKENKKEITIQQEGKLGKDSAGTKKTGDSATLPPAENGKSKHSSPY